MEYIQGERRKLSRTGKVVRYISGSVAGLLLLGLVVSAVYMPTQVVYSAGCLLSPVATTAQLPVTVVGSQYSTANGVTLPFQVIVSNPTANQVGADVGYEVWYNLDSRVEDAKVKFPKGVLVDRIVAAGHTTIAPSASETVALTWAVPTYAPAGEYQILPFAGNDQPAASNVFSFTVRSDVNGSAHFNGVVSANQLKVWSPDVAARPAEITYTFSLDNPSDSDKQVDVSWTSHEELLPNKTDAPTTVHQIITIPKQTGAYTLQHTFSREGYARLQIGMAASDMGFTTKYLETIDGLVYGSPQHGSPEIVQTGYGLLQKTDASYCVIGSLIPDINNYVNTYHSNKGDIKLTSAGAQTVHLVSWSIPQLVATGAQSLSFSRSGKIVEEAAVTLVSTHVFESVVAYFSLLVTSLIIFALTFFSPRKRML